MSTQTHDATCDTGQSTVSVVQLLQEALEAAKDHLEYCGYGDNWERECAMAAKLPEQIDKALAAAKGAL